MQRDVRKVVVLGANGAMGAGSGEVFAAAGIPTVFLARSRDKARQGMARAEAMAKSEALGRFITLGSYEEDLEREVADADLIFEAVSEELALKREFFERIDRCRKADSIVGTVSSGLSIAAMTGGRSASFASHFLGIHFFNPPNVIVGCELIPHAGTDKGVTAFVADLLRKRLGRELVVTSDTPAFCGNRVGFKVLNECAQLAEEHGPAYIDALLGPHTGRAMAPLATIDFVGWDVHKAIVDNLHALTKDEAHAQFAMPKYMAALIEQGHLGNKTVDMGGFFRRVGKGKEAQHFVLTPKTREYVPAAKTPTPDVARKMKQLHHVGRYKAAFDVFAEATGPDADLMRRVILGYVSYGLMRVGEVVERAADVDRIMGFGFNWAPPSVLVDVIGARRTVALLEAAKLPVPRVVTDVAERGGKLFDEPTVDLGRFFQGK
ncbi:MAG: 3-hydroxyacyl-CoA dehydrogenase family protein [Deltaproteobacteria bacterium]|nr:3-hydroxyacyl-CoA dehydrogenase family protein [Deltaproteobacteria bacterium]